MAACRADASRISNRSAGDAACEGGIVGDDGEDGPKDACGLAHLLRMGWFQQVHAKSIGSQEIRALLVARKQLLGRLLDVELSIRGILRGFGLKVGQVTRKTFEARIRELVTGQATLERFRCARLYRRSTRNCTRLCSRLFVKTRSADG